MDIKCDNKIKCSRYNDWYQSIDNCVVIFNEPDHFFSIFRSLSKIIIYIYVKMHIIFVTLTRLYRGEELKGHFMSKTKRKAMIFFFQLHFSLSRLHT